MIRISKGLGPLKSRWMKLGGKCLIATALVTLVIVVAAHFWPHADTPEAEARRLMQELRRTSRYRRPSRFEQWLVRLRLKEPRKRRSADEVCRDLMAMPPEAMAHVMRVLLEYGENEPISSGLRDVLTERRKGAGAARVAAVHKAITPVLIEGLRDSDSRVRANALGLVQFLDLKSDEVLAALIETITDEDAEVRSKTVQILCMLGLIAQDAAPVLVEVLENGEIESRRDAAFALGHVLPLDAEPPPALLEALQSEDKPLRVKAALSLKRLGRIDEGLPVLTEALRNTDRMMRLHVAIELGSSGGAPPGPGVVSLLTLALKDEYRVVRGAAILGLDNMGAAAKDAVPQLIELLEQRQEHRCAVLDALAQIGSPLERVIPVLVASLGDEDEWVRRSGAQALASMGPAAKDAIPALKEALKDKRQSVRKAAAEALKRIQQEKKQPTSAGSSPRVP